MKIQNLRIFAFVALAAALLATTAMSSPEGVFAYKKNQATSQANACGNDFVPINVGCQNTDSQIQGDENSVALAAQQTFPEVTLPTNGNGDNGNGVVPTCDECFEILTAAEIADLEAALGVKVTVACEQLLAGTLSTEDIITAGLEADISLTTLLELVECLLDAISDIV